MMGYMDLYTPEYFFTELENHLAEISHRSRLEEQQLKTLLDLLFERIRSVPKEEFRALLPKARKIIHHIDPDDVPFFALALSLDLCIWSDDAALKKQTKVKIWSTEEVIKRLKRE